MGLVSAASLGQAVVFAAGIALILVEAVLVEQGTLNVRIPGRGSARPPRRSSSC